MSRYFLGINVSHDRAAMLVRDGEPVCAIAEERLDRRKHSIEPDAAGNYLTALPRKAIAYCLERGGVEPLDLSGVYISGAVVYHPGQAVRNPTLDDIVPQHPELFFGEGTRLINHHEAHAAGAFFASPFEEAAVLVVDGGGNILGQRPKTLLTMPDVEHTSFYHAQGTELALLHKVTAGPKGMHSLGALYQLVTHFAGFGQFNEGKTMGLAPYGEPRLYKQFKAALRTGEDLNYQIDPLFQPFDRKGNFIRPEFLRMFGSPRNPEREELRPIDRDMAYAVQRVLEETLIELARNLQRATGSRNLVISGGVGLNSVANKKVLDHTDFENVFIVPSAADDGCAVGCALLAWHQAGGDKRWTMRNAGLGRPYCGAEIDAAIAEQSQWYDVERPADIALATAEALAAGDVVGWFQGGAEIGPRALGRRSILCDPRRAENKDLLNAKVKHREGFRPFAPAVPLGRVSEFFDLDCPSPFMLLVAGVRQPDLIPAVTHVDCTARVQTTTAEENGAYHELIERFGDLTGVPVILNTSFNVAGEPIVETPTDAINCYLSTQIDVLVLEDRLLRKQHPASATRIAELNHELAQTRSRLIQRERELYMISQSRGWKMLERVNRLRSRGGKRQPEFL